MGETMRKEKKGKRKNAKLVSHHALVVRKGGDA